MASPHTTLPEAAALKRSKRGIVQIDTAWPTGKTLNISVGRLTSDQQKLVQQAISTIAPHVNLNLNLVQSAAGDIRIGAIPNDTPSWSAVGVGANNYAHDEITLGLVFDDSPEYTVSEITHEILHALGFLHEHQHPDRTTTFNKGLITERFEKHTDPAKVAEANILNAHNPQDPNLVFTPYDKDSILHYGFTSAELNGANIIPTPLKLSQGDIEVLRELYPFDQRPTLKASLSTLNATAVTDKLWPTQSAVTVSIQNMNSHEIKFIKHNINRLAPYLPVNVKFVDHDADIRITLERTSTSWSYTGTDAKNVPPSQPTMGINLGGSRKNNANVVKQAFARALGLENVKIPKNTQ